KKGICDSILPGASNSTFVSASDTLICELQPVVGRNCDLVPPFFNQIGPTNWRQGLTLETRVVGLMDEQTYEFRAVVAREDLLPAWERTPLQFHMLSIFRMLVKQLHNICNNLFDSDCL